MNIKHNFINISFAVFFAAIFTSGVAMLANHHNISQDLTLISYIALVSFISLGIYYETH